MIKTSNTEEDMGQNHLLEILQMLSDIKATGAATAQKVDSLQDRLFNGGSGVIHTLQQDITEIKSDRASQVKWDRFHNIMHYTLTPVLVTLHAIARHFGIGV
jgi:hypothetical protein